FEAGDPIVAGPVVGQQAGPIYLLHPIAGGMPWFVSAAPPPRALGLPSGLESVGLPQGWDLTTPRGPVQVGRQSRQPVEVRGPGLARAWPLPSGRVGVLSPIAAQITGLHAGNDALERERAPALPDDPDRIDEAGPRGGDAVFHEELA